MKWQAGYIILKRSSRPVDILCNQLCKKRRSRIIHTYMDAFRKESLVAAGVKDGTFWNCLNLGSYECMVSSIGKWINCVKFFLLTLSFLKRKYFYWRSRHLMSTYYVPNSLQSTFWASSLSILRTAYMVSSILLILQLRILRLKMYSCPRLHRC